MTKKKKFFNKRKLSKTLFFIGYCLVAAIMVFPILWALSMSLSTPDKAYVTPPKFFVPPLKFSNYLTVLQKYEFIKYLGNTLFLCVVEMIVVLFATCTISFGFAKYDTKGISKVFFIGLCTMFIPSAGSGVLVYIAWSKLGAVDTYLPMIIPPLFGSIGWIFLVRQTFKSISNSFFEAAYIDGANPFYILWGIYVPLAKPVLANLMLRTFMGAWNNLMGPLIYINTKSKYTLSLALAQMRGETGSRVDLQMAGTMLSIIPIVLVYFVAQKFFVKGDLDAGVKE